MKIQKGKFYVIKDPVNGERICKVFSVWPDYVKVSVLDPTYHTEGVPHEDFIRPVDVKNEKEFTCALKLEWGYKYW